MIEERLLRFLLFMIAAWGILAVVIVLLMTIAWANYVVSGECNAVMQRMSVCRVHP